jgi:hypothetical protein
MSAPTAGLVSLFGLDPEDYRTHPLHSPQRTYMETNCYSDILIELLHAAGCEPLAAMGCALRVDFEGDQWTFMKPEPEDLRRLFGVDIHEMQPYRDLPDQAAEQIADGRTLIVELDSYHLPDTVGTSYRNEHVKSSVAIEAIDREAERMRYFHATGLHELREEDYRGVFRLGRPFSADVLPPYTELVRFDAGARLEGAELRACALELARGHLARRPASNPFVRFGAALERELPRLLDGHESDYHAYAFATVRMAGSAFEVAASLSDWLIDDAAPVREPLVRIVEGCKALSFRLARRRAFEPGPALQELAGAWEQAVERLDAALERAGRP